MKSKLLIGLAFLGFISLTSCKKICKIFCGVCQTIDKVDPKTFMEDEVIAYNPSSPVIKYLRDNNYAPIDSCNCVDNIQLWKLHSGNVKPEDLVGLIGGNCDGCDGKVGDITDAESLSLNFIVRNTDSTIERIFSTPSPAQSGTKGDDLYIRENIETASGSIIKNNLSKKGTLSIVDIGIVDSGEGEVTPYLSDKILAKKNNPSDCYPSTTIKGVDLTNVPSYLGEPADGDGHGTAVNCIALGYPGNFYNERIVNAKFLKPGMPGTLFKALCGSYYAIEHGAKILNWSWGYLSKRDSFPHIMLPFFKKANDYGVLIVAGAGNDGHDIDKEAFWPASFNMFYSNIISVGGLNHTQNDLWDQTNYGTGIDVYAPSDTIKFGCYKNNLESFGSGTSFAAPKVSFVLAQLMSIYPSKSPVEIKKLLIDSYTLSSVSTRRANLHYKKLN